MLKYEGFGLAGAAEGAGLGLPGSHGGPGGGPKWVGAKFGTKHAARAAADAAYPTHVAPKGAGGGVAFGSQELYLHELGYYFCATAGPLLEVCCKTRIYALWELPKGPSYVSQGAKGGQGGPRGALVQGNRYPL